MATMAVLSTLAQIFSQDLRAADIVLLVMLVVFAVLGILYIATRRDSYLGIHNLALAGVMLALMLMT